MRHKTLPFLGLVTLLLCPAVFAQIDVARPRDAASPAEPVIARPSWATPERLPPITEFIPAGCCVKPVERGSLERYGIRTHPLPVAASTFLPIH